MGKSLNAFVGCLRVLHIEEDSSRGKIFFQDSELDSCLTWLHSGVIKMLKHSTPTNLTLKGFRVPNVVKRPQNRDCVGRVVLGLFVFFTLDYAEKRNYWDWCPKWGRLLQSVTDPIPPRSHNMTTAITSSLTLPNIIGLSTIFLQKHRVLNTKITYCWNVRFFFLHLSILNFSIKWFIVSCVNYISGKLLQLHIALKCVMYRLDLFACNDIWVILLSFLKTLQGLSKSFQGYLKFRRKNSTSKRWVPWWTFIFARVCLRYPPGSLKHASRWNGVPPHAWCSWNRLGITMTVTYNQDKVITEDESI